jgi:hypothetical protein
VHGHALAQQQRAHAAHNHAVLGQQGHRRAAGIQVLQHRGGGLFGKGFEVAAAGLTQVGAGARHVIQLHVGLQAQYRHVASHQSGRQGIRAAGFQHQPGARPLAEQRIGGRRPVVRLHPGQRHQAQRALQITRAARLLLQPLPGGIEE